VGSPVRVTSLLDLAERFLGDASSLIRDARLPEATLRLYSRVPFASPIARPPVCRGEAVAIIASLRRLANP
jgi:hypothetical protein